MAPHLGLKKKRLGLVKKNFWLFFNICLTKYPKTTDPFFRISEKKKFKVWVKSIKTHIFIFKMQFYKLVYYHMSTAAIVLRVKDNTFTFS
jgi:hypothetical protein